MEKLIFKQNKKKLDLLFKSFHPLPLIALRFLLEHQPMFEPFLIDNSRTTITTNKGQC